MRHSNLAHIVQTDLYRLGNSETITLADDTAIDTVEALFAAIYTNDFYKLSTGFYPFVFTHSGECVAHGYDSAHVGRTLAEIVADLGIEGSDENLNAQFTGAAEKGGAWVGYPWKNERSHALKYKYAYILKATAGSTDYYVGVGFQDATLQEAPADAGGGAPTGSGAFGTAATYGLLMFAGALSSM